jgi:hypothetical protein
MVHELTEYLRGWIGYFGRCETPSVLGELVQWLRRRLRSMLWKQWKRGTTRYRELRERGIVAQEAAQTAGSSDGPWHFANTPALKLALSNAYLASLGLPEAHGSWLVQPAEPPDADPHVRWCGRGGRATVSPIPILDDPAHRSYSGNVHGKRLDLFVGMDRLAEKSERPVGGPAARAWEWRSTWSEISPVLRHPAQGEGQAVLLRSRAAGRCTGADTR